MLTGFSGFVTWYNPCQAIWQDVVHRALTQVDIFCDLTAFVAHGSYPDSQLVDFGFAHNTLLDKRIKSQVNAVLAEKGMSVRSDSPDMLAAYHVGVKDKVQVTDWGYRYSDHYWGWGGRDIDVSNYEEGTLIIDFVDAQTKELVWRGAGSVALDSSTDPQKSEELIRKVVGKILSQYPPRR